MSELIADPSVVPLRRGTGAHVLSLPTLLAVIVLAMALVAALVPFLFTSFDPVAGTAADAMTPPGFPHLAGTDYVGRDLLARIVYGAQNSLSGAALAVVTALAGGTILGVVAGVTGGRIDAVIVVVLDVLLAVPGLLLLLSIIAVLGFGHLEASLAVGVAGIPAFARVVRSEVLRIRSSPFVEAARGSGSSRMRVVGRHVLPNSLGPVLSLAPLEFGSAILALATLGFLGYGAPPPAPEWGQLVAEGRNYIGGGWWLTVIPGLTILVVVLAANQLGRALRGRWNDR